MKVRTPPSVPQFAEQCIGSRVAHGMLEVKLRVRAELDVGVKEEDSHPTAPQRRAVVDVPLGVVTGHGLVWRVVGAEGAGNEPALPIARAPP